ncbi:MAG: tripartite tricarboxylate transporter permease [Nitriliruptorales bacterium]|nr:tripartite tricarboxylate transporter permease [Nitriliruptorales bacterium]
MLLGTVLGLLVGVLPGIGGTAGVAILLPVTVFIAPGAAIMMLAGIYWGSMYGGIVTSILFGVPGNPWSVAVMFDGRPLAKQGRAGLAMMAAFTVSFTGAIGAALLFTFLAQPFASLALRFGAPELFAILLLAFATFVGLGGQSPFKTLAMIAAGLLLATIGLDTISGTPRLTFGTFSLLQGIHFIPVTIGLFGVGEILYNATERIRGLVADTHVKPRFADFVYAVKVQVRRWWAFLLNLAIGFVTGLLPGLGATPASFMAYGIARRTSKHPEDFGKGSIEGVMAPEIANNAAGTAAILPMLTLGIPGSPTAAVIMAGLFIWGLTPGPLLFEQNREFVWGFITSLYFSNTVAFLICIFLTPLLAMVLRVPYAILTPIIVVFSLAGAFTVNNSLFDIWLVLIFGVLGLLLRILDYPLAPLVVALVLGFPTEAELRRTLILGDGSPGILFTRPISAVVIVVALLLFAQPLIALVVKRLRKGPVPEKEPELVR